MQNFTDFKKAIQPTVNKITRLSAAEGMSAIKYFSKRMVPMLFEGAKTGKFTNTDIDFTRNILANFNQNLRINKMSDELKSTLETLKDKCVAYYNSLDDLTTNEEKALYGLRQSILLCSTNRLSHSRVLALIADLNETGVDLQQDEVIELNEEMTVVNEDE